MDRHRRDEAEKAMIRRPVPPSLAGMVTDIVHYRERFAATARQVETAALVVPLVIVLGSRFRIGLGREPTADDAFASFTSGLLAAPVLIDSLGEMECVQVNFTPLGARRFFGIPMSELSGSMIGIDALGDTGLGTLRERIAALEEPDMRLDLITSWIATRLAAKAFEDPIATAAYRILIAKGGDVRIEDLARRLDVSRKHLTERFRDAIGLPPKAVARVARFNAAQALARRGQSWSDIAYACGYADQAHLAREFADLAGASPTEWLRAA